MKTFKYQTSLGEIAWTPSARLTEEVGISEEDLETLGEALINPHMSWQAKNVAVAMTLMRLGPEKSRAFVAVLQDFEKKCDAAAAKIIAS